VRIVNGPLVGTEGIDAQKKCFPRLSFRLTIMRSASVEIDAADLEESEPGAPACEIAMHGKDSLIEHQSGTARGFHGARGELALLPAYFAIGPVASRVKNACL